MMNDELSPPPCPLPWEGDFLSIFPLPGVARCFTPGWVLVALTGLTTLRVGCVIGVSFVAILQTMFFAIRRFHDTGRSGWWLLLPSESRANRYGPISSRLHDSNPTLFTGMQVKSRGVIGKRLKILMLRFPF